MAKKVYDGVPPLSQDQLPTRPCRQCGRGRLRYPVRRCVACEKKLREQADRVNRRKGPVPARVFRAAEADGKLAAIERRW